MAGFRVRFFFFFPLLLAFKDSTRRLKECLLVWFSVRQCNLCEWMSLKFWSGPGQVFGRFGGWGLRFAGFGLVQSVWIINSERSGFYGTKGEIITCEWNSLNTSERLLSWRCRKGHRCPDG